MTSVHLTEDQIDDYLIGDLADDLALHLDGCAQCQAHVAAMEAPITSFKEVSLAWSERQSATMLMRPAALILGGSHKHRALWATAATAAVAMGIALPIARHESKASIANAAPAASTPIQTFTAEREQQIAEDNQMLLDINRELGARVSSPSETFGLEAGTPALHNGSARD